MHVHAYASYACVYGRRGSAQKDNRVCVSAGPDTLLVTFPASEQTVTFKALSAWTKTERSSESQAGAAGTAVNADISFQYRLRPAELPQLYDTGKRSHVIAGMLRVFWPVVFVTF